MTDSETICLSRSEVKKLLLQTAANGDAALRDWTIITVGINLMLRRHEIADMTIDHIYRNEDRNWTLFLPHTKAQCSQEVHIPDPVYRAIKQCNKHYSSYDCLWPSFSNRNRGCPISDDGINRMVKRTACSAGLNSAVNASTLRHTGATIAAAKGASLIDLQDSLRHATTEATIIYLHENMRTNVPATERVQVGIADQ